MNETIPRQDNSRFGGQLSEKAVQQVKDEIKGWIEEIDLKSLGSTYTC
jgi:hypothetical protein